MTRHFVKAGRNFNAHVYVSNDLDTLLVGVLCAGASRRLIYDAHELYPDQFVGMQTVPSIMIAVFRIMESVLLKRVDTVITVNEFISAELETRYDIRKPEVVLNVPKKQQTIQVPRSRRHEHKIALYQGRYERTRGLENVVRACGFLLGDITLVLRGYGQIETELREIAKAFGNCRFEAPVLPSQLVWAASNADVGIVPYVPVNTNNYYASPNKLFEYVQAGLPVVASDLPFLRKIVVENKIGCLFNPRNPKSIADAINVVTRDENLQVMKANVRKTQDQYCWDQEQKKLLMIIMKEHGRKHGVH
jgi:glycosyltransferase involved in cell wall biosynthesis